MMNLKGSMRRFSLFAILATILIRLPGFGQSAKKSGGVGFRIDENPPISRVQSYDSLFTHYWAQKYSFAVTSYVLPHSPDYTSFLSSLSNNGIELMDNTPTHATQFFNVLDYYDTLQYTGKPGVDHINGQKICLKYVSFDTTHSHGEGRVNLSGNKLISHNNGEFHDLLGASQYFALYLCSPVNKICLFYNVQSVNVNDPDTLYLHTFWDETYSSSSHTNFRFHKLMNNNVVMHDTAVQILAKRSLGIFDSLGLPRPYTWVQPEGKYPWINPVKLKSILGDKLGYKQSTAFINPSFFCYNEVNTDENKQFGINSEELNVENGTFSANASIIANAIARHFVLFDYSFLSNQGAAWDAYILRMDSLLAWCTSNYIPIRTYSQWKSLVYDSIPQKVINVFPKLDVDLDTDSWPDGYDRDPAVIHGIYDPTDGVPASSGICFKINGGGMICRVTNLAGLEKGSDLFSVFTKGRGHPLSKVKATVSFPETGQFTDVFFASDSTDWVQHSIIITVPSTVNIADFSFTLDTVYHDTVKISGISFRSSGFLSESKYPLQQLTANLQFQRIDLNSLIIDSIYPPSSVTWTFKGNHSMNFRADSLGFMIPNKPVSFWVGKDSVYAIAHSPDGLSDSCFFRFRSDSVPSGCAGTSIMISILDTLTSKDYVAWTSSPHDSSMTDTSIYNPVVSPKATTRYRVKVYNLLGNIFRDSITIKRFPVPVPGLFKDSTICKGNEIALTAHGGTKFVWNTGDTVASIIISPDTTTRYWVRVTNQWNCSASDTSLVRVERIPVVHIMGLLPQYCTSDDCVLMSGTPSYPGTGIFGGSQGVTGSLFCPNLATVGSDTGWYRYTSKAGCANADTAYVTINQPLVMTQHLPYHILGLLGPKLGGHPLVIGK